MGIPRKLTQFRFPVKRGVVHDDRAAFGNAWQKRAGEPILKNSGSGASGVAKRRGPPLNIHASHDIYALKLAPALRVLYLNATRGTPFFTLEIFVNAAFVNVDDLFGRDGFDLV